MMTILSIQATQQLKSSKIRVHSFISATCYFRETFRLGIALLRRRSAMSLTGDSSRTEVGVRAGGRGSMGPGNLSLRMLDDVLLGLESVGLNDWLILLLANLGTSGGDPERALSTASLRLSSCLVFKETSCNALLSSFSVLALCLLSEMRSPPSERTHGLCLLTVISTTLQCLSK